MKTGIIILAAGNSSRLGKPKQLLTYRRKTLLAIVSDEAQETGFSPIITVLGAYADEISKTYQHTKFIYVVNDSWEEGMSSSIVAGLSEILRQQPNIENIIITVADQVFITSALLINLLEKKEQSGKNIVASSYAQTTGTPALFNKRYFDDLMELKGNKGAKYILQQYEDDVATIDFELGLIDIDTEADYNNLTKQQ